MKLFIFTDLHGNQKIFDKIKKRVKKEKPDAILCGGDITSFGVGAKTWLNKYDSLKIPLFVIPGNPPHETIEEVEVYSKPLKFVKNLHLRSTIFNSVLLLGIGNGGFTNEHEEFKEIEKSFAKEVKKVRAKNKDAKVILMVHQPPYKTEVDYLSWAGHTGSKPARRFIEKYQPDLCLTGHLHETFGKKFQIKKTLIINPGPKGIFVEI